MRYPYVFHAHPDTRDLPDLISALPLCPLCTHPLPPPRRRTRDRAGCAATKLSTNDWKGKKVVLVAVPGAFTVRRVPRA